MKYNGKNVYSSGDLATILGFEDYHRISNYLNKIKAKNVTKKGNTRYYDEEIKETVITYFKALKQQGSSELRKDKLIEKLRGQLLEAQKDSVKKLAEQKEIYERLIVAKDDDISNLKDTITNLREQQKVTNEQIKELTMVTKQAQSLNLADKSPEQLEMLKDTPHNEKSDEESNKKQHSNWFNRIFK